MKPPRAVRLVPALTVTPFPLFMTNWPPITAVPFRLSVLTPVTSWVTFSVLSGPMYSDCVCAGSVIVRLLNSVRLSTVAWPMFRLNISAEV